MNGLESPTDAGAASVLDTIRLGGVITGIVVLIVTWFAVRILTGTLSTLGDRFAAKRLVLAQIATLSRFVIYLLGLTLAVGASIHLSKEVILALTGTAAVTIGFALKDLAASVLAGITIIADRPFQVGDRVTFGGYYGEITEIGLRSVRLVTLDDNVITIPNNKFLTEVVSSGNLGALDMLIQQDFHIGIDQDFALAKRLVTEAITSSRFAYLKKRWNVSVNQVVVDNYFAIRIRSKVYVLDVQYEKALETDVTERVMTAFREHGIRPPAVLHRSIEGGRSDVGAAA
jgi:small-conductance mechanosensitive channel